MMIRKKCLLITFIFISSPAHAWRETGHFTVGEIASRHLSKKSKEEVAILLNNNETLASVSVWPDEVRDTPEWNHTYNYHFVTIEDHQKYLSIPPHPKGDALQALIHYDEILRNPKSKKDEKTVALKFIVHLVGDIHQPLHVGRGGDKGGNTVLVTWFGRSLSDGLDKINLHKVWDFYILQKFVDDQQLDDGTQYRHKAYASFLDTYKEEEISKLQESSFLNWVEESFLFREFVYRIADGRLGQEYYDRVLPAVHLRVRQAGYRLAGLLNSIFEGKPMLEENQKLKNQLQKHFQNHDPFKKTQTKRKGK